MQFCIAVSFYSYILLLFLSMAISYHFAQVLSDTSVKRCKVSWNIHATDGLDPCFQSLSEESKPTNTFCGLVSCPVKEKLTLVHSLSE